MHNITMLLMSGMLATSLVAGCGDDDTTTAPTPAANPPATNPAIPVTPPPTPPTGGPVAPLNATVTVGDIFFRSEHNGSSDPAVDTVAVNGTVNWALATTDALQHSVQSLGSPSFISSGILTGAGSGYSFTFTGPGIYQYDCAIHGEMMTGTIVVLADSTVSPSDTTRTTHPAVRLHERQSGY